MVRIEDLKLFVRTAALGSFSNVAREVGLPVTTHAGVWGATNDDGIRLMHEHGFMQPDTVYVHAATLTTDSYHRIAATGGSISVSTESEQSAAAELDGSLARMGFDHVDLIYATPPPEGLAVADVVAAVGGLLDSGKARAWAVWIWRWPRVASTRSSRVSIAS